MPGYRSKIDTMLPSTSRNNYNHKNETILSVSPSGRIAKRNAQLINEIDIKCSKRNGVFSETCMGTIPDFETYEIDEKCFILQKILDSENNFLSIEDLNFLQKQIEDILADNADNQKRIHGEITFLNTGEYPTDDLKTRLMPNYILRPRSPTIKVKNQLFVENISDLGLNSSPDDDEENPSVVDIPQRFWNWSREYLRHITDNYVMDFKEKMVDHFNPEFMQKYFQCNKECTVTNDDSIKPCTYFNEKLPVDTNSERKCKKRLLKVFDDCLVSFKKQSFQTSPVNGNGNTKHLKKSKIKVEDDGVIEENNDNNEDEVEIDDTKEELINTNNVSQNDISPKRNGFYLEANNATFVRNNMNESFCSNLFDDDTECDKNLDEVSRELIKKQKELAYLIKVTYPVIAKLYERIESEYALYETSRRLDIADDKIFELSGKYDSVKLFTNEQRNECAYALTLREKAAKQFYYKFYNDLNMNT